MAESHPPTRQRADTVLSAFNSAFPTLYTPQPNEADGRGSDEPPATEGAAEEEVAAQQLQADPYAEKIQRITSKFLNTRLLADELEAYLKQQDQQAKEAEFQALAKADLEFTPAWRNGGLPMKPSMLQLDEARMSGARLVDPKSIMSRYQTLKGKEVLNPPHIWEYNDKAISPNYTKTTHNLTVRQSKLPPETLQRARDIKLKSHTWHLLTEQEVARRIAESDERRRLQDLKMPATQYDLESKIIESMHHKLSFLRNPRYALPPAVKQLQTQFKHGHRWNVPEVERPKPPIKSNMTAKRDVIFVVEPETLCFTDYEAGGVYMQKVRIRNVTGVIRTLRLFPPASQYFHITLLRFPIEQGIVAPGMFVEATLRFCPDSLADYEDEFAIDTAESRYTVPVWARRLPPSLTLPHDLHVGDVLVGNRKVTQFTFSNLGGPGRFRVIPESLWPSRYSEAPTDMARVGPFEVWPLLLDVMSGEEATLNVCFEPDEIGSHRQRMILVCDNCQVKDFVLSGLACDVDVILDSIDGKPVAGGLLDLPVWFGEVVPGSGFTRHLAVRNATALPFPFIWKQGRHPQTRATVLPNTLIASTTAGGTSLGQCWSSATMPIPDGGFDTTYGPMEGSGAYGKMDLVALGMENQTPAFVVEPAEGILQPGEVLDVAVTFLPLDSSAR